MKVYIGTAGWSLPKQHRALFPAANELGKRSHLELYGSRLRCVEVNSSFHRPHRRSTWERWARVTPSDFRFAVKMPKVITHVAKLASPGGPMQEFFAAVQGLGDKLGPVLVQLPPKLNFDEAVAHEFFTTLRELHSGAVALEPRHPTWFTAPVDQLLRSFEIARVAADPPAGSKLAARPGGWYSPVYWRLHGTPHIYYSEYEAAWLRAFAQRVQAPKSNPADEETWVIFDNTALGHGTANAVWMDDALRSRSLEPNRSQMAHSRA